MVSVKVIYVNVFLNFNSIIVVLVGNVMFGLGRGFILLDDVKCLGNEIGFGVCDYKSFGVNNCDYIEDAGVFCFIGGLIIFFYRNLFFKYVVVIV